MEKWRENQNVKILTELPIAKLLDHQLERYNLESIHSSPLQKFDAKQAVAQLHANEGAQVLGADFGGDKGIVRLFEVKNGSLVTIEGYSDDIQGDDGRGYLQTIERASAYALENSLPFGLTWGGPMDGTQVLFHPKAKQFIGELNEVYDGDLAAVSPSITACMNDGPAGLVRGAVEAYKLYSTENVAFVINGGGLGFGMLANKTIHATEAGHVEGVAELNTYDQTTPCGVFSAEYVCIERLGANKAGIEDQWQLKTGSYMRARDIEDRYKEGNQLAGELYEHSAYVAAHMIAGAVGAYGIALDDPSLAIVCHGGAFKFPYYGDRVLQLLAQKTDSAPRMLMTKDFGAENSNACLEGAAIMGLLARPA